MAKVVFQSWNEGLEKVSLTKLQMNILGMSLKESKINVDDLLDGKTILFVIDDNTMARTFYNESIKLGVNCEILLEEQDEFNSKTLL